MSQADRYLLQQIRQGDPQAWEQLVERFQGRLVAFARSRAGKGVDADDLVQDTFLQFLSGLPSYRQDAGLETWLFMILRRRIIDLLRGRRVNVCNLQDSEGAAEPSGQEFPAPDLTASTYARRDEQAGRQRQALAESLECLVGRLKEQQNFRDLKIIELLFYAQVRNKEIAKLVGLEESAIALIKHRWLRQLAEEVATRLPAGDREPGAPPDSLLTEVWEQQRPSCPKRSTVGGFLLGTLDAGWNDYVGFHLHRLGCRFCLANLQDLQTQTAQAPRALRDRVMQSTVGFFRKA